MKDTDNTTKKLIKNIISLLVSALVLIAATVAWFTSNSKSTVSRVRADLINEKVDLTYYTAISPETLDLDITENDEVLVIHGESSTDYTVQDYFDKVTGENGWTKVQDDDVDALDIDPLFPGEFHVYRVDFRATRSSALFCLNDVQFGENADTEEVGNSIYAYASARVNSALTADKCVDCLNDLLNGGDATARLLDLSTAEDGDKISVYYLIGMPGRDDVEGADNFETHDTIRMTGAEVSVGRVGLYGSSAAAETPAE